MSHIQNATITLLVALVLTAGCESARTLGRDPLLGKTRLDPPQTEPRSVYVDRQNPTDSGVVPGGVPQIAAQPTLRTTNYPGSGHDSASETVSDDPLTWTAPSYVTRFPLERILPPTPANVPATHTFTPAAPRTFAPGRAPHVLETPEERYARQGAALASQFDTPSPVGWQAATPPLTPMHTSGSVGSRVPESPDMAPRAPSRLMPGERSEPEPASGPVEAEPGVIFLHTLPQ